MQGILRAGSNPTGQIKRVVTVPYPDVYEFLPDGPLGETTLRTHSFGYLETSSLDYIEPNSGVALSPQPSPTVTSDMLEKKCAILLWRLNNPTKTSGEIPPVSVLYKFNIDLSINMEYSSKYDLPSEIAAFVMDIGGLLPGAKELLHRELSANTDEDISYRGLIISRNIYSTVLELRETLLALGLLFPPVVYAECDPPS